MMDNTQLARYFKDQLTKVYYATQTISLEQGAQLSELTKEFRKLTQKINKLEKQVKLLNELHNMIVQLPYTNFNDERNTK